MRRRYRKTGDLRPYAYVGLTMLGLIVIGASFNSFSLIFLSVVGLVADVLGYGILVQHWRFRSIAPFSQITASPKAKSKAANSHGRPPLPNPQSPAYNLRYLDPRLARLM